MILPPDSRYDLSPDLNICRILNGLWQVSGAHGRIDPQKAIVNMFDYHESGFTTWDLADHYGPAEDFIGYFRRELAQRHGEAALSAMQAFTKWVPRPGAMTRSIVEAAIDHSLTRMQTEQLDMLQFHWWDYKHPAMMDALHHLADLQRAGKIRHLSLTNFDTEQLSRIHDDGISILSNQVQFSLIDQRPRIAMQPFCTTHGIYLLTYGTLCGGLLTDRYLGQPEPSLTHLNTASLRKYKNMIDTWGGWQLFQVLLQSLRSIADKHSVSIANVAVRAILDEPGVAGVIAGARLGYSDNHEENARSFSFQLGDEDRSAISAVLDRSRNLYELIGDCGSEYRS